MYNASERITQCPFDFLNNFNDWFNYQKGIHFDKLTPEQSKTNVLMEKGGAKLIPGMKYDGWTMPNAYASPETIEEYRSWTKPLSEADKIAFLKGEWLNG